VSTGGSQARTPLISPDGRWIWDGRQWLPFANPSSRPLQTSPDGKWMWDGSQWLPVARSGAANGAVFPAWSVVTEAAAAQPVARPRPELEPIPVIGDEEEPEPVFNPYEYAVEATPEAPAWIRPSTGLNRYMYVAAGFVVLVMAAIVLSAIGPLQLPWTPPDKVLVFPSPTPPITARTEAGQADQLLSGYLGPALANLDTASNVVNEVCNGTMTLSCRDDIREADNQVKNVLKVTSQHPAVPCIAAPVAALRVDLAKMDTAFKQALLGYQDSQPGELAQGLASYRAAAQLAAADRAAAAAAEKSVCGSVLLGP